MNIGFLIERNIFYKSFGSVIDTALKRGHRVFCFHDYSQPQDGQKGYQFPDIKQTPLFINGKPEAVPFSANQELIKIIKQRNVAVLVSLHFLGHHIDLREYLKGQGVFWVSLQHSFDSVAFAKYLHVPDRYFIYSDKWLEWMIDFRIRQGIETTENRTRAYEELKKTVKTVGFSELVQKSLINKSEVRQEWGIPPDKKVVLFLPFPFGSSSDKFWAPFVYGRNFSLKKIPKFLMSLPKFKLRHLKQIIKGQSDKNVATSIQQFCRNNNAYLLVKSRKKDPVPSYIKKIADKILYDEDNFYPAAILKCLSISDLCVHFYSSVVTEAIAFNVPCLCIAPPQKDWESIQGDFWALFIKKTKKMFNFPGASYLLSIPQAIKTLPKKTFNDFILKQHAKQEYIKEFIGEIGADYSSLALNEIESLVNTSKIE